MNSTELRTKAKRVLLGGNYKKALELFSELHKRHPEDVRVHAKVAELREKIGDTQGAVQDYLAIAHAYAEQGFVVQAIAIDKIILRLDPTQTQVRDRLKELSSERGDDWALRTISPGDKIQAGEAAPQKKLSMARTPLLSGLSGKELEDFINSLQLRHVEAGEYIYRLGDHGNHLYLIGMGTVLLKAHDTSGREKVFSRLGDGDFFGEHAFMSRTTHSDAAVADSDCSILMIDRATFDAWVGKYPSIQSTVEGFYRQRVLARVLAITPVFEGIPQNARLALADRFQLRTFAKGATIVREGEAGQTFYLIRSGRVHVFTSGMQGKGERIDLGDMGEGEFFGEVALLTDKPRTATVVAADNVELMELKREDFDDIVSRYPSVRKIVEAYQKKRVQDTIKILLNRQPR